MKPLITLEEFIYQNQRDFPSASGELSGLLRDIGLAAKIISREVNRAGLTDIMGIVGSENFSGDQVQKLDVIADNLLLRSLKHSGECCGIASEEQSSFVPISGYKSAKYVVAFDPLDGSSNIDANVSIGTIFSIYERLSDNQGDCSLEDFTQGGLRQAAAGYVLYGSSTMLVYTTGRGVNGFTLDRSIGEFCLSHPGIRIPQQGKYYSVNQANFNNFEAPVRSFIEDCMSKGFNFRYIGSMVADVHRTLLKGGIFMYPATVKAPQGKLRLLYECNPLAMIVEQAGGMATDGKRRILELEQGEDLHQRCPVFMGSPDMVQKVQTLMAPDYASAFKF